MKKLLLIFLAAVLMLPLYTQSAAAKSVIDQINQAMIDTYGQGFGIFPEFIDTDGDGVKDDGEPVFNQHLFNTRRIIVYGEPSDFGPANFDPVTKNHRYLGYTYLGENYTNTLSI
ncbi:hypothetical protein M1N04_00860 [Peptococcaceae bacterium]|nr:hypothetical protein [Peptococcaceae bacterium]